MAWIPSACYNFNISKRLQRLKLVIKETVFFNYAISDPPHLKPKVASNTGLGDFNRVDVRIDGWEGSSYNRQGKIWTWANWRKIV
jgi:hypothetical protein